MALFALGPAVTVEDENVVQVGRKLPSTLVHCICRNVDRGRNVSGAILRRHARVDQQDLSVVPPIGLMTSTGMDEQERIIIPTGRKGSSSIHSLTSKVLRPASSRGCLTYGARYEPRCHDRQSKYLRSILHLWTLMESHSDVTSVTTVGRIGAVLRQDLIPLGSGRPSQPTDIGSQRDVKPCRHGPLFRRGP